MKNYIVKWMLCVCLGVYGNAFSQVQITGNVIDSAANPIENVEIMLLNALDSTVSTIAFSDVEGFFVIEADMGNYIVVMTYLTQVVYAQPIVAQSQVHLGKLTLSTEVKLATTWIEAYRPVLKREYDKWIFQVAGTVFEKSSDAWSLLQKTPQIRANANGGLLIRNQSPLVMVDGKVIHLSGIDLMQFLQQIQAENIQSIEIQTTGGAEYDANHSGGVIQIVMKKHIIGLQTMAKAFYKYRRNVFGVAAGNYSLNYGKEKWHFYTQGGYRRDYEYVFFKTQRNFFQENAYNATNGSVIGLLQTLNGAVGLFATPHKRHEIGAELRVNGFHSAHEGKQKIDIVTAEKLTHQAQNFPQNKVNTRLWYTTLHYSFQLDTLGSKVSALADVGRNIADNQNITDIQYLLPLQDTLNSSNRFMAFAPTLYYTMQADWVQKSVKNCQFATGIKYGATSRSNRLDIAVWDNNGWKESVEGQQNFQNQEEIWAGYGNFAYRWKKKHNMKMGLRAENTKVRGINIITQQNYFLNYLQFFPNLYYGYEINENQNLSFSYARRIQRPSFTDLNPFVVKENDFSYIMGNPRLNPQYTHKAEISYAFKTHYFSLYGSNTHQMIWGVYRNNGNVSYYQPQNAGKAWDFGLDYSHDYHIKKWLYANVSTGISYYRFQFASLTPHRLSVYQSLNATITFSPTLTLDVYHNFFSPFQYTVTRNATQYILTAMLQKTFWHEKGTVRLYCEDVFNTSRDKNVSNYADFSFEFYQKRITRAFVLMFIYRFDNQKKVNQQQIEVENSVRERM